MTRRSFWIFDALEPAVWIKYAVFITIHLLITPGWKDISKYWTSLFIFYQ